jgi:integrase
LSVKLRDRATPNDDEITRETRISRLSELWIDEITAEERIAPQTIHRYQTSLRTAIVPALGNLRIREASVGRLDRFLRGIAKDHPSAAKGAKVVLNQMFALAVRHGAIPTNPTRDTGRLRKPRRPVLALTDENLQGVRAAIREWQQPIPGKPGPRHTGDLADVVDLMLATGARIGEILALRWEDLDLAAERPTLTICGTLVFLKGEGIFRQAWTKTDAGFRMIVLPRFAVNMLMARKLVAPANPYDAARADRTTTVRIAANARSTATPAPTVRYRFRRSARTTGPPASRSGTSMRPTPRSATAECIRARDQSGFRLDLGPAGEVTSARDSPTAASMI